MSDPTQPPQNRPSGLTSGDPLGGSSAPTIPSGYTSPPPPGAGGSAPSPSGFAPGSLRLASWWSRVGAAIIDGVLIGIVAAIIMVPLGIGVASSDGDGGTAAFIGAFILSILVFAVVALLYAPLMMSRTNGQTIGRKAVGIRVVRAKGEPMTFGFAAIREVAVKAILFGALGQVTFGLAGLIDVLWPLWDEENRALHDMIVNTRVVQA